MNTQLFYTNCQSPVRLFFSLSFQSPFLPMSFYRSIRLHSFLLSFLPSIIPSFFPSFWFLFFSSNFLSFLMLPFYFRSFLVLIPSFLISFSFFLFSITFTVIYLSNHLGIYSFIRFCPHSLTHSLTHSPTHPPAHPPTHSFTHSFTLSLTRRVTQFLSLSHIFIIYRFIFL